LISAFAKINLLKHFAVDPCVADDPTAGAVTCAAGEYATTELCYFVSDADKVLDEQMLATCQSKHANAIPVEITSSNIQTCLSNSIRADDAKFIRTYIYVRTGGVYTNAAQTVQWNGKAASSTSHFSWRDGYPYIDGNLRLRVINDPADAQNGMYTFTNNKNAMVLCQYDPTG